MSPAPVDPASFTRSA